MKMPKYETPKVQPPTRMPSPVDQSGLYAKQQAAQLARLREGRANTMLADVWTSNAVGGGGYANTKVT